MSMPATKRDEPRVLKAALKHFGKWSAAVASPASKGWHRNLKRNRSGRGCAPDLGAKIHGYLVVVMAKPSSTRTSIKKGPKGTNELTGSSRYRAAAQSRITHLRIRGTGEQLELPSIASYTVGREPAADDPKEPRADLRLPSAKKGMSLVHARFEWRKDLLWCEDAGSTNGTLVNGESVLTSGAGPARRLKPGDNVRLGHVELTFTDARALREFVLRATR